ncbi:MAG: aspartate aminotransferase family protein [Actinobacteria bacterium]|nr:MAG: aspartate aminotransferase family protein [Actinomycetota bacterium]
MGELRQLLDFTSSIAAEFLESLPQRPVLPALDVDELRRALGGPLPEETTSPIEVIAELARAADPGIAGMPSGRWFGFVLGGSLPAALAADWLTSAWDQNAGLFAPAPAAAIVEEVAGEWMRELFGLPDGVSFGFVTGCQMAHVTCLAAARHHVLAAHGWDVERDGLFGAPRISVVTGAQRHVTIDRALRFLGFGAAAVDVIPADEQGRIVPEALRSALEQTDGPTIICVQAGEVNTGAFDALDEAADAAAQHGAWLHVDAAFGIWAAAEPSLRHLLTGVERADSWAADAHKWLNVPYDSGLAFCRHPDAHRKAMGAQAAYLIQAEEHGPRDQLDWNPEFSRRARGFPVYAALRSLGRSGVAKLVEQGCAHARRFGEELALLPGCEVLNDVVLNQVLFRFGSDEETEAVLAAVQASGEAWMSGTIWQGRRAIRISVSNWSTTDDDVSRTLAAFAAAVP